MRYFSIWLSRKPKPKEGCHFYPLPQSLPPGEGGASETRWPRTMQRQVDSLNAGLQPFPAKLSANPLKALEAKRSELTCRRFSSGTTHAAETNRNLNDLTWTFWITAFRYSPRVILITFAHHGGCPNAGNETIMTPRPLGTHQQWPEPSSPTGIFGTASIPSRKASCANRRPV